MAIGFFGNTPEAAMKKQISDKLNFINEKYTDIGRYVKLNLAEQVEDKQIKQMLKEIDSTLAELKGLNEQLNTMRGVKLCTSCGREIPIGTLFCPVCGQKQPAAQTNVPQQNNMQYQQYQQPASMPAPTFNNQPATMPEMASPVQAVPMPEAEVSFDHAPEQSEQPEQSEPIKQPEQIEQSAQPQQDNSQGVIPEKAAEQPQTQQQFLFCSQCGNKQPAEKKFCSQCGSPML